MEARAANDDGALAVTVAVPTMGRRDSLQRLLRALSGQTLPASSFEAIVCVDGGSREICDDVERFAAPFRAQALWQPRRGRASACNTAIRSASGEVVVVLDDDMEPTRGCLEAHLLAHPRGSRRCVVGAAPIEVGPSSPPLTLYMARKFEAHLGKIAERGRPFGIRDFYSGNASIRRAVLTEVGPFDESFRAYGNEDLELAFRLGKSGVTIQYSAEASARQHYAKRFDALARDTAAKGRTAVQFAAMHPEAAPELQFAAGKTGSRAGLLVLEGLLRITSVARATPTALTMLAALAERAGFRRLDTLYRFLLEYFYWLGVQSAQPELPTAPGPGGA